MNSVAKEGPPKGLHPAQGARKVKLGELGVPFSSNLKDSGKKQVTDLFQTGSLCLEAPSFLLKNDLFEAKIRMFPSERHPLGAKRQGFLSRGKEKKEKRKGGARGMPSRIWLRGADIPTPSLMRIMGEGHSSSPEPSGKAEGTEGARNPQGIPSVAFARHFEG